MTDWSIDGVAFATDKVQECCACIHPSAEYYWVGAIIGACAVMIGYSIYLIVQRIKEKHK